MIIILSAKEAKVQLFNRSTLNFFGQSLTTSLSKRRREQNPKKRVYFLHGMLQFFQIWRKSELVSVLDFTVMCVDVD